MSGEERSLPQGWEIPELGDLIELQNGFAFSSADYSNQGHFLIRIGNVQDAGIVLSDPKKVCLPEDGSLDRFNLEKGDILTSLTGNVGRIAVIEEQHLPAALNQRVAKISLINAGYLTKPYLLGFLRSDIFKSELIESGHGAAQQNVSTKEIAKISIPLAPLAEQKVIADTLEVLLAQVDTLQARLDAIPAILKRFRQSVLSAAVTGKLTEEWRGERCSQNAWEVGILGDLLQEKPRNGYSPKSVEYETGVKSLSLSATTSGIFKGEFFKHIDENIPDDSYLWLEPGDILIQRANTLEYVGISAIFTGDVKKYIFPDLMMKCRANSRTTSNFLGLR